MKKRWPCALALAFVMVVWTGVAHAALSVSPSTQAFGNKLVGTTSTIDEQITGDGVLASFAISGTGCASVVTVVPTSPEVLPRLVAPGNPLPITISFKPAVRGAVSCTVDMRDAVNASLGTFIVTGTGVAPEVSVPASTSFGTVRVTTGASTTQNILIGNSGDTGQNLSITALAITGADFSIVTQPSLPATVAPGATVTVTVKFDPSASGTRNATLDITSTDPVAPTKQAGLTGLGGNAVIGVSDVNFGAVTNGTTATQNIVVTNTAAAPLGALHVSSGTIVGGSWFTFADNGSGCAGMTTCSFVGLDVTTTANVAVRCNPPAAAAGMQTATVSFANNGDSTGDPQAALTCFAGRPDISVDKSTLAFGDIRVGQSSAPQTVTITNVGNRDLTYDVAKSGTFSGRYTLGGACVTGCTVAPLAQSSFTVTFSPDQAAQMDIGIAITSNDPDTSPFNITVTGRGVQPAISGPSSVAFGNVEVGKTSGSQPLTITNTGTASLTITSAVVQAGTGDYTATGTAGMQIVTPGATATWNLVCNPTAQGSRPGNFRIQSDAANAPTLDVPLSCTGTRGNLVVSPTTLPFGGVPQDTVLNLNVTLSNTGNLAVGSITAVSSDPAYSVVAGLPTTLAAGGMATVTVRFSPTATHNGGNATITFEGVWGTAPTTPTSATLAVSGTGLTNDVMLSTATVDFGNFRFDTQPTRTFCVTNSGMADVTINSPIAFTPNSGTASTEYAVTDLKKQTTCGTGGTTTTLPVTLASTEVLEVTVRAQPANRIGTLSGTLKVSTSLPTNPDKLVALTGNAITGMLTVTPGATVNFGIVDIQGAPSTITVKLKNTGAASIDLQSFARTADPAFTFTLPPDTTLAPNTEISFPVTFAPTVASAVDQTVTVTHSIAGDINLPGTGMIVLRGRGGDRDLEIVGALPAFPDTFRNPGTDGPVRVIGVHNKGTAPLHVSMVMASNDPDVWSVLDPDPITIPPDATADVRVRFQPKVTGRSEARLQIVNDDVTTAGTTKITEVPLTGNCIARDVALNPSAISAGYVEVGGTVRIPGAVIVTNLDLAHTFTIQTIKIDGGDDAFTIDSAVDGLLLDSKTVERRFPVTFTPKTPGHFTAKVRLYLDQDTEQQAEIDIEGTAVFVDARGGGGCSTGAGVGGGMIALVLLFLVRRRAALVAMLVLAPAAARADDIVLSIFDPTPATTTDGFQVQSPLVGAHGSWAFSSVFSYASDPLVHRASAGGDDGVVTGSSMVALGGAIALLDRFEVGASMPFYSQVGEELGDPQMGYTTKPADGTAAGDLHLHGKVAVYHRELAGHGSLAIGGSVQVTVPTSSDGMLTGTDNPSFRMLALGSLVPGAFDNRLTINLDVGAILRAAAAYQNIEQKSGVEFALGASLRVADPLWVTAETFGQFMPSGRQTIERSTTTLSPIEWLVGGRFRPDRRFTVSVAAGRGLTSAVGAPALRGVVALTFTPHADAVRPIHGPAPLKPDVDTDRDHVVDRLDRCPQEAEDIDGFQDDDGCPDPDNDNDGVADQFDKCPLEAEDKDGFEDLDGCIDKDNDSDGIPDVMDKCPNDAEDKDGFRDDDGCPDLDNDGDGIPDPQDRCPNEKEVINGNQDDDGCPDKGDPLVVVTTDHFELMDTFQWSGAKLTGRSFNILGQVGGMLRQHPEVLRIRIAVHVHPTTSADKDQELSDKRAQAIKEWLVQWGVADKRVDVRGFGSTKPLGNVPAANERVEIVIMEKN